MAFALPSPDCPLCPRLAGFRADNKVAYKDFFNAPVPSFGQLDAQLLVVGLAPGLKGANRTGRPFTGDYAGLVLYSSLLKYGFAKGEYKERADDGLTLANCRITNSVRCVPQENKPETSEIKQCNAFLKNEIAAMRNVKVILTLGLIAHKAVLMACGYRQSAFAFGHGMEHVILCERSEAQDLDPALRLRRPQDDGRRIMLLNSYHCSRYNINTGALTQAMFDKVVERARELLLRD